MPTYSFADKLSESQNPDLRLTLDRIYARLWPESIVIKVGALTDLVVQSKGQDFKVTIRTPHNAQFDLRIFETIEEKIRSPWVTYPDILVETESCRERGTAGWIYHSEAHWLSYVRQPGVGRVNVCLLPMSEFRDWFTVNAHRFAEKHSHTYLANGAEYTTVNRVVPLNDDGFRYFWHAHGCRQIDVALEVP